MQQKKKSAFPEGSKYDSRCIFHVEHDAVGRFTLPRQIFDLFGFSFWKLLLPNRNYSKILFIRSNGKIR